MSESPIDETRVPEIDEDEVVPTAVSPVAEEPEVIAGRGRISRYLHRHPLGAALLIVIGCALLYMLGLAGYNAYALPERSFVETDARARVAAPAYDGGDYGSDDPLVLKSLEVVGLSRSSSSPDGTDVSITFGASAYANADIIATYSNGSVEATKTTSVGYARQRDSWVAAGEERDSAVAYRTSAGIEQAKVIANIDKILARADAESAASAQTASRPSGDISLAELYEGAAITIRNDSFDEGRQTETMTIHMLKQSGFSSYECDIDAVFVFHAVNGVWELSEAEVTGGARDRNFRSLIGTWQGRFKRQETSGTKCLAAGNAPLTIAIKGYTNDTSGERITALVSGLAHYHAHPAKDANSSKGDTRFEEVEVSLYLQSNKSKNGATVFSGLLPETAEGVVTITVSLDESADSETATATVKTDHSYDSSFIIIPIEETATWTDTYVLERTNG